MTQSVPVWSGTTLHSLRLATVQLSAVTTELLGCATSLLLGALAWLPIFPAVLLVVRRHDLPSAGFWLG